MKALFFSSYFCSGEEDSPFILVAWRGKTSLRSYVAKGDRQHILRMVGGPVEVTKKPRNQSGNAQGSEKADASTEKAEEGKGEEEEKEEEEKEEDASKIVDGEEDVEMGDDADEDAEEKQKEEEEIGTENCDPPESKD